MKNSNFSPKAQWKFPIQFLDLKKYIIDVLMEELLKKPSNWQNDKSIFNFAFWNVIKIKIDFKMPKKLILWKFFVGSLFSVYYAF